MPHQSRTLRRTKAAVCAAQKSLISGQHIKKVRRAAQFFIQTLARCLARRYPREFKVPTVPFLFAKLL